MLSPLQISLQHSRVSTIEAQAQEIRELQAKLARAEREYHDHWLEMEAASLHAETERHSVLNDLDIAYDSLDCVERILKRSLPQVNKHLTEAAKATGWWLDLQRLPQILMGHDSVADVALTDEVPESAPQVPH